MKIRQLLVLSATLMFVSSALANDGQALLKKYNCATCHKMGKKTVGPGLEMIASKYKGDASAQTMLEAKVRHGGKGSFGGMPMPPTPASVSDSDIKTLVSWILSLK